ncbi:Glyoxalase/Bleomycin resistance protein/Dioxygenase superfamily protein [Rhizobium sp. RU20A]|uniref:VOC family protein n=1 Tax=Rhizobium sp. RU20A TaxID=1907412 RepID=UPI000956C0F2|nr:VOC family protein [Rhizobium sp. RU20A]SIQ09458.1 Glyoxalase/Bleomycin resistance protein/Dioxygenase superfamily protein [Rhizobium sp. RU20A]
MLHHVELYVSDIDRSHAFWTGILGRIGYEENGRWADGFTVGKGEDAYLTFVQVAEKHRSRPYHRGAVGLNHLAFRVATRAEVDALRQFCIETGASLLYDDRYPFANGGEDYYALYVEDPDRIKVEFVADE